MKKIWLIQLSLNQPYFRFISFCYLTFSVNNVIPHTILCYISIIGKNQLFPFLMYQRPFSLLAIPLKLKLTFPPSIRHQPFSFFATVLALKSTFPLRINHQPFSFFATVLALKSTFPLRINHQPFSFFATVLAVKSTFPLRISHQPFSFFATVLALKSTFPLRINHQPFSFFATVLALKSTFPQDQPPAIFVLCYGIGIKVYFSVFVDVPPAIVVFSNSHFLLYHTIYQIVPVPFTLATSVTY